MVVDIFKLLSQKNVVERVEETNAVVLERIARGGGDTNWYYCDGVESLTNISNLLMPGSIVNFYFDSRIKCCTYKPEVNDEVLNVISETGDCVVGKLNSGNVIIDTEIITGIDELLDFVKLLKNNQLFFWGAFPSTYGEDRDKLTFILPDSDGIVRANPH